MAKKNETKLTAAVVKQLKKMGFNCTTEEEARKKLLAALEKEGVEGMEDETLDTLIDMVDGFRDSVEIEDEEPEEEVEDEESDEVDEDEQDAENLADEVEAEDDEENSEEEVEDEESDEVDEDEEPEENSDNSSEEEPEDEVEPVKKEAPVKKATKKAATKKAAKKEVEPKKRQSKKLNPQNNPEAQKELIAAFEKMFPADTYTYTFVVSSGMSVKYIGNNSKRGVFLFDNLTRQNDGVITGNLYLNTMTKETDVLDEMGIDYKLCWTNAPFIKAVTIEEAIEILEKVYDIITSFVAKVDKRLGDNRKKMEENLEKTAKKTTKKAATKKAAKKEVE